MTTKELYESNALNTIRLYGKLGAKFGRTHRLAVSSAAEAVRALCVLFKGFEAYFYEAHDKGMAFTVFYGKENVAAEGLHAHTKRDIRIAPVIMGAKSGGIGSIILGAALIGISFLLPGGSLIAAGLFNAGLAMAIGGVVQLLSPQPKDPKSQDKPEDEPNYAFNGPINTQAQGNCVPVAYGRPWTGSAVISAGIQVGDDIYVPATNPGSLDDYILSTGPKFYYPVTSIPAVDLMNNQPNLIAAGTVGVDSDGATYDAISDGLYAASAGGLTAGLTTYTVMGRFRVSDIVGGAISKILFGHYNNTLLGYHEWSIYLTGPNKMRPAVSINGMAGGGTAISMASDVAVGDTFTLGWRRNGMSFQLLFNGAAVVSTTLVSGAFGGSAALYSGGAYESASGGYKGSAKALVGWDRALSDSEVSNVSAAMLAGYATGATEGEGDNYEDAAEEIA